MEGKEVVEDTEDGEFFVDDPESIAREETQSSTTETGMIESKRNECEGYDEIGGDPNADDYSARDRAMKDNEEGVEGDVEEDDLSSFRGIRSTISTIKPVDVEGV